MNYISFNLQINVCLRLFGKIQRCASLVIARHALLPIFRRTHSNQHAVTLGCLFFATDSPQNFTNEFFVND